MGIAHFALDFSLGRERGHRVDDHHVHGAGADHHVCDLERLFAGIRLGDQQVVGIHAEGSGVDGIQRVLGIDEGAGAADFLRFRDDLQRQRGLSRGLGTVDLDHAAARQPADAQRDIEPQGARGDGRDGDLFAIAQAHHGALAELALDLGERCAQRLVLLRAAGGGARGVVGAAREREGVRLAMAMYPTVFDETAILYIYSVVIATPENAGFRNFRQFARHNPRTATD